MELPELNQSHLHSTIGALEDWLSDIAEFFLNVKKHVGWDYKWVTTVVLRKRNWKQLYYHLNRIDSCIRDEIMALIEHPYKKQWTLEDSPEPLKSKTFEVIFPKQTGDERLYIDVLVNHCAEAEMESCPCSSRPPEFYGDVSLMRRTLINEQQNELNCTK